MDVSARRLAWTDLGGDPWASASLDQGAGLCDNDDVSQHLMLYQRALNAHTTILSANL